MNDNVNKKEGRKIFSDNPAFIISDEPSVAERDLGINQSFQFDSYAKTLSNLIANKYNKTPLVLGIYGPWGSGKTTLMKKMAENLEHFPGEHDRFRVCKTVWFQPWKLESKDEILAGLIEEILRSMARGSVRDMVFQKLEELSKKFSENSVLSKIVNKFTVETFDVSSFFGSLRHQERLGFYHIFETYFSDLIWTFTRNIPRPENEDVFDDEKGVVVIFIDDLDRCEEDRILKVLETIKLFVNQPGCVVVMGVDRGVLKSALEAKGFKEQDFAEKFMQKIVQVTFELPTKTGEGMKEYLKELAADQPLLEEHSGMIARALEFNPRAIKRFLNDLNLSRSLISDLGSKKEDTDLETALLIWTILGIVFPDFVKHVRKEQKAIEQIKAILEEIGTKENWRFEKDELKGLNENLHEFIKNKDFADLIREYPKDEKGVITPKVVQFTSMTKPVTLEASEKPEGHFNHEAMVTVPKGEFKYGEKKVPKKIERDFKIDVYPVTNKRYANFIADGGYEKEGLWAKEGWQWLKNSNITQPEYWDDPKYNHPDQPVVGVSWYEAEAFANWEEKQLPTEIQWERAARGTDGREYPWGERFDKEKCNSAESGIGHTTPVNRYPEGKSEAVCFDMAGNVWEWCSDWYDESKDSRVLRGGSWGYKPYFLRTAYRFRGVPALRVDDVGFRCAQR